MSTNLVIIGIILLFPRIHITMSPIHQSKPLLVNPDDYISNFIKLIQSSLWVFPKIYASHVIVIKFMCHCEYEKCRKEGGILQKFGYLKNKTCFLVEILNALGFIKIIGI